MFYDYFLSLCSTFGVTPKEVRKATGISQSTMASWKSKNIAPNYKNASTLASYFGLFTNEIQEQKPIDFFDKLKTGNLQLSIDITKYRIKKEISPMQFAKELGFGLSYFISIERGLYAPFDDEIEAISSILGENPDKYKPGKNNAPPITMEQLDKMFPQKSPQRKKALQMLENMNEDELWYAIKVIELIQELRNKDNK